MTCPRCQGRDIRKLSQTTGLGSVVYRCQGCRQTCNERTGTPFHFLKMPTDLVSSAALPAVVQAELARFGANVPDSWL
jgi:transposase-like protein